MSGLTMMRAGPLGLLLVVAVISGDVSTASGGTDILIVEKPGSLAVYNKYQQEATAQDRALIGPFVPMTIVRQNDLLSDGYTKCMQVEVGGSAFYLLKGQDGRLVHSGDPGSIQTFPNVTPLADTIRVAGNHSLSFLPVKSGRQRPLTVGEKIVRFFLRRNEGYCQVLDGSSAYGWIDFTGKKEGREWKAYSSNAASTFIPDNVVRKIRARVNQANDVFVKLFEHFNHQTLRQMQAPRWDLEVAEDSVLCVLEGAPDPEAYLESTLYLAKDIENYTLGAQLQVAHSPGRIEVTTRGDR